MPLAGQQKQPGTAQALTHRAMDSKEPLLLLACPHVLQAFPHIPSVPSKVTATTQRILDWVELEEALKTI